MSTLKEFLNELEQESIVTRKMLSRIPANKHDW
jgi:DNA-binding HxlR family transcriptional regulator